MVGLYVHIIYSHSYVLLLGNLESLGQGLLNIKVLMLKLYYTCSLF